MKERKEVVWTNSQIDLHVHRPLSHPTQERPLIGGVDLQHDQDNAARHPSSIRLNILRTERFILSQARSNIAWSTRFFRRMTSAGRESPRCIFYPSACCDRRRLLAEIGRWKSIRRRELDGASAWQGDLAKP